MENEKLTYINSRGERLELGVDSVYHCNISKDVEGISGVTSVIYSTNSMGQHGDTYVGQRIEARDIDIVGHINTRDKAQALELRRRMLKIFNPELSATLVYEYGGFKRVIDCRAYGEPKILKKEVLYEFDLQIECLNPFWREEEETKEDIASWVAAWHFPCVIEKDSTKSMIYGYRAESVIVDCYNEGDVSTGMRIRFDTVGVAEFFALLYIAYEVVSIFKNMALCGLPVKKVWEKVREFLAKYTDELPDTDELDGDSTTGNVEEHRTQER